tara:strand:- start:544 stop:1128 length:585 start_codon:yes stop_codon:yes gene_type:complete
LNKNMKYSRRNSFILLDEEKKEIRKLYEATTASASGSYSQPLSYKEDSMSPCEAASLEAEVKGEDNIVDGSEEINLDVEDLMGMIGLSEEEDIERMRRLHRENSIIEQQMPEIDDKCKTCIIKALGKYSKKADYIYGEMEKILKDGEVTQTEFTSMIGKVLMSLANMSTFDVVPIGMKLYGCQKDCEESLNTTL